jgi:hypothetical protein
MSLAPIVLFVYNRPWHTEQILKALSLNPLADQSTLYIYADGPKKDATEDTLLNIKKTQHLIKSKKWCKEVFITRANINKGLANSIIEGVTEVVNRHGKVIVLEDDLVTDPFFLTYMNKNLDLYENNPTVISIHGFMYPVKKKISSPFFLKGADCWGWATWKRGWDLFENDASYLLQQLKQRKLTKEFDFNGSNGFTSLLNLQISNEIDSWAIRWYASAFLLNKLTLYPPVSLVYNIGFDGSGTHKDNNQSRDLHVSKIDWFDIKEISAIENKKVKKLIEHFFRGAPPLLTEIKKIVRRKIYKVFKKD